MAAPSCFFVCLLTELLSGLEGQWSVNRFAILDFHASARGFSFQWRQTFEWLARIDGDLDVRPVSDILVGHTARDHSHLALVDRDRAGLRMQRAAAFVLECPLIRAQIAVPAALLPITIGHFDDEIFIRVQHQREVTVFHIYARDDAFLEDVVELVFNDTATTEIYTLFEEFLVALDD